MIPGQDNGTDYNIYYNKCQNSRENSRKDGAGDQPGLESYNIHRTRTPNVNTAPPSAFTDLFDSLATGRDSSDKVLRTIILGLLEGSYQDDGA